MMTAVDYRVDITTSGRKTANRKSQRTQSALTSGPGSDLTGPGPGTAGGKAETNAPTPGNNEMQLDDEACYRVFAARDRRFEGRFVMAVVTTGVYCRPGCPARTPLRRNVRFYPGQAAAEAAGFRPCLRCRPDAAPGTPATVGTGATVARALRLLAARGTAPDELGERLGIGERHLRRLFSKHLGASPTAVARSRRDHFARRLLEETELPLTEVALAAGFSSPDRCAAALRSTFGLGPRELRRRGAGRQLAARSGHIALRLPYRPPFDWAGLLAFLGPRAIPGVERVEGDSWARTVSTPAGPAVLRVRPLPGEPTLVLEAPAPADGSLLAHVDRIRHLFDLDADPHAIGAHLGRDPLLAPLIGRRPGLRVPGTWDPFETAVRAILGQQISVAGATTLAGRLAATHGEPFAGEPGFSRLFPTPAALASLGETSAGMPAARVRTIRAVAAAVLSGAIDFAGDRVAVRAALLALPGIGPWTVSYLGMRALADPDAFPAGDLGVRRALASGGPLPSATAVEARAEPWRPYRAYAAMHLWVSLSDLPRPSRRSTR